MERHLVAVVDGNPKARQQISDALLSFYAMVEYPDATRALAGMGVVIPSLVLVGEQTPPFGGIDFIRTLRQERSLAKVPVLFIANNDDPELVVAALEFADAHLVKPYRRSALIRAVSAHLNYGIERKWEALPPLQREALKGTVEVFNSISDVIDKGEPIAYGTVCDACSPLVEAVAKNDFRSILSGVRDYDNYSYAHSLRVATLLSLFGYTIGLPQADQLLLASGGLLHDVGKMSIPHEVLNKPGRLTPEEWVIMRGHVPASVHYLKKAHEPIPKGIITIAEQHHEKLDGSGYPNGLVSAQLNELARMASIVDVFGALTDRRIYKPPMDAELALKIMVDEMVGHLDQKLVKLFKEMLLDAVVGPNGEA
ncbi:MAG TPA: HD domain-containing phosphohydrolase [Patescibacteria group bacterium]|nr:HD domain-containing phosphohydrolase [Patescibacteria group bacterium]